MITTAHVIDTACRLSGFTREDLLGPRRYRPLVQWRMAAIAVARQRCMVGHGAVARRISYPLLAERFGHRDHTTVLSAVRRADTVAREQLDAILSDLDGGAQ